MKIDRIKVFLVSNQIIFFKFSRDHKENSEVPDLII